MSWISKSHEEASAAAYLLHDSFDADGSVFVHRDGSLAMGWELGTVDSEVSTPESLAAVAADLAELFKQLPIGAAAQFILYSDTDVRDRLRRFRDVENVDPELSKIFEERCRHLVEHPVRRGGSPIKPRILRLFFTVRVFPDLGSTEESVRKNYKREKEQLIDLAVGIEIFFTRVRMSRRRFNGDDLVRILYALLNPTRSKITSPRSYKGGPEDPPIRHQVVRSGARFDYKTGIIEIDGVAARVLSMVQVPDQPYPGMLSRGLDSAVSVFDDLQNGYVTLSIEVPDDTVERRRLERRENFAYRQLLNMRQRAEVRQIKEETEAARMDLRNGKRMLKVRLQVVVYEPTGKQALHKSKAIVRTLDGQGIEMIEEDAYGGTLFFQSLPMNFDPESDRGMRRTSRMLNHHVATIAPWAGSYQGTVTQDILLQNPAGEPITFSPFDSINPHMLITGISGAGKSFFANYALLSMKRRDKRTYICMLDRGNSYRRSCAVAGGQYVRFDKGVSHRINPCGRTKDFNDDKRVFIAEILIQMCQNKAGELTLTDDGIFQDAIWDAFQKHKTEEEIFLSHIYAELMRRIEKERGSIGNRVEELAQRLHAFVGEGAFARYFDGPNEVDLTANLFNVVELGENALKPRLMRVLLMAILKNVLDFCSAEENQGIPKIIAMDEAWTLLKTPETADALVNVFKTFRKYGTSAWLITQQPTELSGPAGEAIRENAPNRIYLMQSGDTVNKIADVLSLPPHVRHALKRIRTVRGEYSEMVIDTPEQCGMAYLAADPTFYNISTNHDEDNARLRRLEEKHRAAGHSNPVLAAVLEASAQDRDRAAKGKAA